MDNNSLTNFYDNLKTRLNSDKGDSAPAMPVSTMGGATAQMTVPTIIHHKMMKHCDQLKDDCRKHILLDIYVKILPVDDDFKQGHMGTMKNDIDCMLKNKGMTATQYMTSCSESTHAPLLEYLMRATDMIGSQYLREAEAAAEDAAKNGAANTEPKEPSINDAEVQDQLVDIKKDSEYETFIDKLKEKTINKIVKDVSDLISDKKEEQKMTFDPKDDTPNAAVNPNPSDAVAESAVSVGLDYIQKHLMKNNIQLSESAKDDILALAIREATLNQFDVVFNQKSGQFNEFASRIRWGKGVLINESWDHYELDYARFTKKLGDIVTDTIPHRGEKRDMDVYTASSSTYITIPESVTEIADGRFLDYKLLKTVKFPKNLRKIGKMAFKGCKCLRDITIPASVTEIDSGAFEGCSFLHTVKILGTNVKIAKTAFAYAGLTAETIEHLRKFEPDLRGIYEVPVK